MRQHERQPYRVIEMSVAEKKIRGAAQLEGPATDVEREPWRPHSEPGLFAGTRPTFDDQIPEAKALRAPAPSLAGPDQISV